MGTGSISNTAKVKNIRTNRTDEKNLNRLKESFELEKTEERNMKEISMEEKIKLDAENEKKIEIEKEIK